MKRISIGLVAILALAACGGGASQATPVPQGPGDELGTVVHPQVLRRSALGDESFDDGHDVVGGAGSAHPHGQGFTGVLVDDVQQLQPAEIRGLVELEVQGPHVIGAGGPEQLAAALGPAALAFARCGTPKAL